MQGVCLPQRHRGGEEGQGTLYIRVACGGDEVEAAVHSCVWNSLLPCDIHFLFQKFFVLLVDVFLNRLPAVKVGERDEKTGTNLLIFLPTAFPALTAAKQALA